ncbi:hypothetical protein Hte_003032 [Hypoxylon texense]
MAPVTRRSARIAQETAQGEPIPPSSDAVDTSKVPLVEEPSSPHEKRKSTENVGDHESDHEEGGAALHPIPISPKRQRLAVRTREDESTATGRRTHLEVEIPVSVTPAASSTEPAVPDESQGVREAVGGPELEPASASMQLEEEATQRLASQSVEPERTPMAKPQPQPQRKAKHITFGDDEDVNKFITAAASVEINKAAEIEAQESSDDEAPEAVSTQAVAKEMQNAAQVASEAAEKQAASLKRKRQEKDSLYKQQAQRRKRARGVEVHQTKPARGSSSTPDDGVAEVEKAVTAGRRNRAEKFSLPAVLPAEFLTDSSDAEEEEEEEDDPAVLKKKPKKINFEDSGSQRPRDRTVGSTRYRVLAPQMQGDLAPRVHKSARASKESLLRRKRAAVAPSLKKGGFFVKR